MTTELISDQWLRHIGFEANPDDPYGYSLRAKIPNRHSNIGTSYLVCEDVANASGCPWGVTCIYDDGSEPDRTMLISELPTRAEVLTLCKVLRIELNNQPERCRICGGMGSIEEEDGVWICPCYESKRQQHLNQTG